MKINSDFRDLLRNLNAAGVRYLIVGGYAVMIHTEPRYTKDLDIWIEPVESNAGSAETYPHRSGVAGCARSRSIGGRTGGRDSVHSTGCSSTLDVGLCRRALNAGEGRVMPDEYAAVI